MSGLNQIHLDHAMEILRDLDPEAIGEAFGGGTVNVTAVMKLLAKAGDAQLLRRFVAVATSTAEELFWSESDLGIKADLLKRAALLPLSDSAEAALRFFEGFGACLPDSLASLGGGILAQSPAGAEAAEATPSGAS